MGPLFGIESSLIKLDLRVRIPSAPQGKVIIHRQVLDFIILIDYYIHIDKRRLYRIVNSTKIPH